MEISVRKAGAEDYSTVLGLFDQIDALHRERLPQIFQQPGGPPRDQEYFAGLLADANVLFLVAEADGELVGFAHAILKAPPALPVFVPRRYAVVDSIVVSASFQGGGIGRSLMDKAQAWAVAGGATSIELNVYEFNAGAIAFYETLGYRTLSRKMRKELGNDKTAS